MKKRTDYELKLEQDEANRLLLLAALQLTDEDMFEMVWSEGMRYLERQCMGHKESVKYMQSEPYYWLWWSNGWKARDEEFVAKHELVKGDKNYHTAQLRTAYSYAQAQGINSDYFDKSYLYSMTTLTKLASQQVREKQRI